MKLFGFGKKNPATPLEPDYAAIAQKRLDDMNRQRDEANKETIDAYIANNPKEDPEILHEAFKFAKTRMDPKGSKEGQFMQALDAKKQLADELKRRQDEGQAEVQNGQARNGR